MNCTAREICQLSLRPSVDKDRLEARKARSGMAVRFMHKADNHILIKNSFSEMIIGTALS